MTSTVKNAIGLSLIIMLTGALCYIATINHAAPNSARTTALAVGITLLGVIPPLFLARRLSNGAASQLAVVAWRLSIMLPAVAIAWRLGDSQRNCFIVSLLACYFVSLPLESWLLIRDVRPPRSPQS